MTQLRQRYLFHLANLCNVPPNQVDALCVWDFFQLILDIDAYRAEMKRINEQNNAY